MITSFFLIYTYHIKNIISTINCIKHKNKTKNINFQPMDPT